MATPAPASGPGATPGDRREDHAQAAADQVSALYATAEITALAAVADLARKVAAGAVHPAIAQARLGRALRGVFADTAPRVRDTLHQVLATTTAQATAAAWGPPDGQAALGDLPTLLDQAADTAAAAARQALADAGAAAQLAQPLTIFAPYQDPHRRAAQLALTGRLPAGPQSLARIRAAQRALDGLARRGITGYTDRAGRSWNLASYVEMATRTAVSNAWDDLQARAAARWGLDLVAVSTHSAEGSCPRCLPWLGRALSLTGATPQVPTLADAKAAGWRHPNCRCFWTPLGAGPAPATPDDPGRAAALYKASQRQRSLERRVRAAHRRAATAVTPAARAAARRELAAARAASDAHRNAHIPAMSRAAARRREHGFRAH